MDETKTNTLTQPPPGTDQRTPAAPALGATVTAENKAPRSRVAMILLIAGILIAAALDLEDIFRRTQFAGQHCGAQWSY